MALVALGASLAGPSLAAQSEVAMPDFSAMMNAANGGDSKGDEKPDFPKWEEVTKDYTKVVSTADGSPSLYGIWTREKDGQILAELPRGYANQRHFFATTVPTGELYAGLQSGEVYGYWQRFDKRVALIAPNLDVRSSGDEESRDAIKNHFVDQVVVDVPIVCIGPSGQPMIDLDDLLLGNANRFNGGSASGMNRALTTISEAKAFPENIEIAFTVPVRGALKTFHYSISNVRKNPAYKPREADERVGYFMTTYRDLGKMQDDQVPVRYINRWHFEKADPKLELSPPKVPLVYYVEHTVPIRYRRWVKAGIDYWNKAFEQVGLVDAIQVQYQDKSTGANMDKDPEDVRYNFIRWLSNDIGTAIGPSRANPETGEIMDADVVLTDGWIRHFWYQSNEYLPELAMEGYSAETLAWFDENPQWDPRVRMAAPGEREKLLAERAQERARRGAGPDFASYGEAALLQNEDLRELVQAVGSDKALCMASEGKSREMAVLGLLFALGEDHPGADAEKKKEEIHCDKCKDGEPCDECKAKMAELDEKAAKKKDEPKIDGIPESFLGPMLADLVAHEVGHTLGLRHNFKASSLYTMAEINSPELKGKKPFAGSVMDYIPVNVNMEDGEVQGDWAMIGLGPYDMWAIEYGYTFGDPKEVVKRAAEPELAFSTDYDTTGPDPLARRYDFSKNPLDYAKSRQRLTEYQRERVLDKFVKDGQPWGRARRGYEITLGTQVSSLSMMANWIGGSFVHNDHKGDPDGRTPLEPVPAEMQREALDWVIQNSFYDEAFGLTPELLQHMTLSKFDDGDYSVYDDATYPVHDRVAGIQASVMSMLLNPTTLGRVYDNELALPADTDAVTLPEIMGKVATAVWSELDAMPSDASERNPAISSLRRNLQSEHLDRLIDLAMGGGYGSTASPVATLAVSQLRDIKGHIDGALDSATDAYTKAHLSEASVRIGKALDSQYIYNAGSMGGGVTYLMLGDQAQRVSH
ncbi:MAG: zinc-dependent metalloprotease [Planctomycetes bacterium]|nr:zinc-dependent metalloprotease [Planctomycetota bacterium]